MTGGSPRALTQLRWLSLLDAVTYVLLLGVAMPLKYAAGVPEAVSLVGGLHGVVWVLLMLSLARARATFAWPLQRVAVLAGAALLPVAPFLLDGRVRGWIAER